MIGRDYRHAIDRPGAQEWEGKAARAAQDTATGDEKVVYRATQHVLDEGPKALDTLAFQVTEHHKRAVGYYNEATSNGYKVSEEITVEWIVPKGAKPETVAEGKRCAAKLQDMIRGEYDKWWAAEEEAAQQIDAISKELDTSYNPIGGLSASAGHLDGAYLQGGTQWDKDVLGRVQAASTLDDQQLKDLAGGKKVDIGSNRMQYLYQFAHSFKNVGEMRDMVSTFDKGHYAGEIINEQAQQQHQQLLNDAARSGSDHDLKAAGRLSQGMLDGALDSVGEKPTDQNVEDLKKLIGKVPFASDAMDVLDSAQKQMENATKLPEGFAQDLAQSGSFGNPYAYQASVLDALAQAHPGITDDPIVGKYINGGHFDPSIINGQTGVEQAQQDLENWFKTTAPRDYNVNLDHWQAQEQMGGKYPNWQWDPNK
ncbi:hypothetical protein MSTE_04852 [Mycobacteroides stephanolepidis]|uniref:Uncharacterized protein n=1 Tax=[Mycobacterium] stephanolepidis TaxID=1520670 RepID=A0A1Z4F4H4_9MYCO|nr:hypothetical protein [[Mycobacterium] stephanolepidis]BAY00144.1 hypothetical protein MSTE_04852 [[Mycobacterium] stephanolepidis]